MTASITRTAIRNLLTLAVLALTFAGLVLMYMPVEFAAIVTVMAAAAMKADDYRIRRARRRAAAQPVPVTA